YGKQAFGPYPFLGNFHSAEVIHDGDRLLDMGCGDGFATKRFYAKRCKYIDVTDIDPRVIKAARRYQSASNIDYYLLHVTKPPFPNNEYDVVLWDGAIGHFSSTRTERRLENIL